MRIRLLPSRPPVSSTVVTPRIFRKLPGLNARTPPQGLHDVPTRSQDAPTPSMYERLFRKPKIVASDPWGLEPQQQPEPPASLFDTHDDLNHFQPPEEDESRDGLRPRKPRKFGDRTVVVLTATTPNLEAADLLRLAPSGDHVDGWVAHLQRVVQLRDPFTLEPRGTYYLVFDSHAVALAYIQTAKRLHDAIKQALRTTATGARKKGERAAGWDTMAGPYVSSFGATSGPGLFNIATAPAPSQDARMSSSRGIFGRPDNTDEALRDFTLVPPFAPLRLELRLDDDELRAELAGQPELIVRSFWRGGAGSGKVLLSLDGPGLTPDMLRACLAADGKERNLPWRLLKTVGEEGDGIETIVPTFTALQRTSREEQPPTQENSVPGEEEGDEESLLPKAEAETPEETRKATQPQEEEEEALEQEKKLNMPPEEGLNQAVADQETQADAASSPSQIKRFRFVLSFEEPVEARRFVREWHRRVLQNPLDPKDRRDVVVNASAM